MRLGDQKFSTNQNFGCKFEACNELRWILNIAGDSSKEFWCINWTSGCWDLLLDTKN